MRAIFQRSDRVSFLFAGSIEHMMRDLFAPTERALSQFGGFHQLRPIDADAWRSGIAGHLQRDRCSIDRRALDHLVGLGEQHPRATMLIAQQAHLASTIAETRVIDGPLVAAGFESAQRLDRVKHEQTVDRIRAVGGRNVRRHTLRTARRIARGEPPYRGAVVASDVQRAVHALRDAGIIQPREGQRGWRMIDPLFRRYLAEMDPTAVP